MPSDGGGMTTLDRVALGDNGTGESTGDQIVPGMFRIDETLTFDFRPGLPPLF